MDYTLKNGKTLTVRQLIPDDAQEMLDLLKTADTERSFIENGLQDTDSAKYAAFYEGKLVGHCSIGLVRSRQRFRHRSEVAFLLYKDFWGLGIGSCMMEECIRWAQEHGVLQIELDVVVQNERAITLYRKYGFEICGTLPRALRYPDGTFADEYRMIKML